MTATATAPTPAPAGELRRIPLHLLIESKTNPRKSFDQVKLQELADSMMADGLHEPIVARQLANPAGRVANVFEIVMGARRYRAAQLNKWDAIDAIVRTMTDAEVLRAQLIENLQREGVTPLEEAEGYHQLLELNHKAVGNAGTKVDVPALAKQVGKSTSYIYQRLKLLALQSSAKAALAAGKIDPGHAILIARLTPEKQTAATNFCTKHRDGRPSVRELEEWIQERVYHALSGAPWPLDDATLLRSLNVPACAGCPKNTANMPDVDGRRVASCADPVCYQSKLTAFLERKERELKAAGALEVVRISAEKYQALYQAPKGVLPHDPYGYADRRPAWRKALKGCDATKGLVVHEGDSQSRRVRVGQVLDICTDGRSCKTHYPSARGGARISVEEKRDRAARAARAKKAAAEAAKRRQIAAAVHDKAALHPGRLDRPRLRFLVDAFSAELWHESHESLKHVIDIRRGGNTPKAKTGRISDFRAELRSQAAKANTQGLVQMLFDLAIARSLVGLNGIYNGPTNLKEAARLFRVRAPRAKAKGKAK